MILAMIDHVRTDFHGLHHGGRCSAQVVCSPFTVVPSAQHNLAGDLGVKLIVGTPLGRFGEPEDIAPFAVFLASEDAHWVAGESLRAAGGVRGVGY